MFFVDHIFEIIPDLYQLLKEKVPLINKVMVTLTIVVIIGVFLFFDNH